MKSVVQVEGKPLPLNRFMNELIGNILDGITRSLKASDGSRIEYLLREDKLSLEVDRKEVPLDLGQAQQIVGNVLRGILSSLRGAESGKEFRFIVERDA